MTMYRLRTTRERNDTEQNKYRKC